MKRKRKALDRSVAQETRLADRMGGERSPRSGAGEWRKADARNETFLVEAKCRADPKAKSISIKLADLVKVEKQAAIEGRIPVLAFELGGRDFVILQEADLGESWHRS